MFYYGLDGDKVGAVIEVLLIRGEVEKLRQFSLQITEAINTMGQKIKQAGGKIVFCAADSILYYGDIDKSANQELLKVFKEKTNCTASIGVGLTTAEAYMALKISKANGGNQIIYFSPQEGKKDDG